MTDKEATQIAVVGFGPRGLGALEALAARVRSEIAPLHVDIYDAFSAPGAGPNFDPAESPVCQLNIPMRDIEIRPPSFSRCGSFAEWLDPGLPPDAFPRRSDLGRYLEARFADLQRHGGLSISLNRTGVDGLSKDTSGWMLQIGSGRRGPYAEVLLTLGQPEVAPDDQLADWQDHAARTDATLLQAYPAQCLQREAAQWTGQTVAVRGFALSAFDVIRVLTLGQGGRFDGSDYVASGHEPACIVPFSIDGRPPYPKPGKVALDAGFEPSETETAEFSRAIVAASEAAPDAARSLVCDALITAVTRILGSFGVSAGQQNVSRWLSSEWNAPGAQESGSGLQALQDGIAMASGDMAPSIGFAVGQVWRKWQDPLRRGYNPATTPPETARILVGFDDGMKRYSYGPPLSASRELLALIKTGRVTLDFTADPEITLTDEGWNLAADDSAIQASVMVDGVLPSPDLAPVRAPLVTGLIRDGRLRAISDGLAAHVSADGQMIGKDGSVVPGLCFLGRLALGSVIAADSLHDCFGQAADRWAEGVAKRL